MEGRYSHPLTQALSLLIPERGAKKGVTECNMGVDLGHWKKKMFDSAPRDGRLSRKDVDTI